LSENTNKEVEQISLGVNLNLFRSQRDHSNVSVGGRPVILYVGRLSQEKDLSVLFEAFRLLNRQGAYQLRIVGDGPLRAKTEKFARTTPHVVYEGLIPYGKRLAETYATADILALPSRNETFGLTVLEALASGIPVVAINQGGPSNLLHPGVGTLAAPGNSVDFAEKLASVLADTTMRHRCRTYVEQHFSWDKTFVKLLDIYENLQRSTRPVMR
jgi:glycosyltransferase involved in cell wall biosynthesis